MTSEQFVTHGALEVRVDGVAPARNGDTRAKEVRRVVPRDPYEPITAEMWEQLRSAWPDATRLTTAWRIARDVDALHDLLAGYAVEAERLDGAEVARARRATHVRLLAPLEVVEFDVAA